ncbi:MAG: ABC transporter substrate-binding protein [Deltaproteobacteria bacterium]|nr:ABC transporter substrate-binding protein [Deltaproteobacteria bacterium]
MSLNSKFIFWLIFLLLSFSKISFANQKPVIIGVTVSLEGKYVEPSTMIRKSILFWVDEINKKGGLLGRKVKLILYNDKSNKDLTRSLYKKLIEKDKVDFVFSPYSSPLTIVASEITEKYKMLMLGIAAAAEKPWQRNYQYLFQLYAPAKRQFIGLIDMMARNNHRTLSILYNDLSVFNRDIAYGIKEWAKLFKIDIVYQKSFKNGKKELPDILNEVKSKGAKGLILSAYPPDCYELLRLLKKMNYKPIILGMPIVPAHPDFHKKAGVMSNFVFGPSQWEPDKRIPFPGSRAFVKGFTKFHGHLPSFHAASAYAGCQILEKAIYSTKSLKNSKLREYIASLNTVTVLGRFKVDQTGKQVGHNSFIIQWQNGKKEIVWPRKMRTATPLIKKSKE